MQEGQPATSSLECAGLYGVTIGSGFPRVYSGTKLHEQGFKEFEIVCDRHPGSGLVQLICSVSHREFSR